MKIELYKNRESDLKDNQFCGTQFEQNAYKLMFDFDNLVELLKDKVNVIKTIHFFVERKPPDSLGVHLSFSDKYLKIKLLCYNKECVLTNGK